MIEKGYFPMQQYSPKNQAFLLAQMPTATDVLTLIHI